MNLLLYLQATLRGTMLTESNPSNEVGVENIGAVSRERKVKRENGSTLVLKNAQYKILYFITRTEITCKVLR
jgi:hypothetical protein